MTLSFAVNYGDMTLSFAVLSFAVLVNYGDMTLSFALLSFALSFAVLSFAVMTLSFAPPVLRSRFRF